MTMRYENLYPTSFGKEKKDNHATFKFAFETKAP